jgi:hypothetical protein
MTDLGQFCNRAAVPFGRLQGCRYEMLVGLEKPLFRRGHIIGSRVCQIRRISRLLAEPVISAALWAQIEGWYTPRVLRGT